MEPPLSRPGLHYFAKTVAGATLVLIFVGGLVTSTGSGLAVPDWPLSFGQVFPPMVGGVLFEHGHRMVAAGVGLLTFALAVWAWLAAAPTRVRALALLAAATVVAQGVLGGATVLLKLPPAVSVAHACLAQAFLCLTVALAVLTGPDWQRMRPSDHRREGAGLRGLTIATAGTVYVQLIVGAIMRHTGAGLAIPDFPLAFGRLLPPFDLPGVPIHFLHRLGAVAVTLMVASSLAYVRNRHRHGARLLRPALLAAALVVLQVSLGALIIWTGRAVVPTTVHVACGAALLATTVVLAMRAWRLTQGAEQPAAFLAGERVAA
jgi:heme a synthase